jgi:glycine/D-amino acid oxidase-like deaminating enzyme
MRLSCSERKLLRMSEIADLAVVGSGFLGLAGAVSFAAERPGASVIVLSNQEQPTSSSASASTGGHILPGFELSNADLIERYGLTDARRLFDFTCDGARHLIGSSRHAVPMQTFVGITDTADVPMLKREIEALAQLGHRVSRLDKSNAPAAGLGGCVGGYIETETGLLRGEQRVAELHDTARSLGVRFVQAEVVSVDPADGLVLIDANSHQVTARTAIIAAGENIPALMGQSDEICTEITTSFRFDAPDGTPDMAACQSDSEPEYYWVHGGELRFGIRATPAPAFETAIERIMHRFGAAPGSHRGTASGNVVHREG